MTFTKKVDAMTVDGDDEAEEEFFLMAPSTMGMVVSTLFSFAYFLRPIHLAIPILMVMYGNVLVRFLGYCIGSICFLSFVLPAPEAPRVACKLFGSILEYFHYDEIIENSPINIQESIKDGNQYIFACQPHGIVPFCAIAWSIRQAQNLRPSMPTAVASMVLWTPILKHLMGMFGCIKMSEMRRKLVRKETSAVRLYLGSTSDLFQCTEEVEVLQLNKRKKFIHVALQHGVDVIPVYMFGNTVIFSQWNNRLLAKISQWAQFPVTYSWGRYGLPIPRNQKLLYVSGQPLGMPKLMRRPRQAHVEFWHKKYCEEVERLFETYKGRVPSYKHKKLVIL